MEPGGAPPRSPHDRRLLPRPPPLPGAAVARSPASSPRWCSSSSSPITPLETIAMNYLLVIHLLQNVVLAEWAPLLVVLGLPAGARGDARPASAPPHAHPPRRRAPALARELHALAPALALRHGAREPAYAPPSRARALLRDREWRCGGASCRTSRTASEQGLARAIVFAAFILGSPIGLVLALVPDADLRLLRRGARAALGALSALEDQQLAGILMSFEQAVGLLRGVRRALPPLPRRGGAPGGCRARAGDG